jgi:hypothetical protein
MPPVHTIIKNDFSKRGSVKPISNMSMMASHLKQTEIQLCVDDRCGGVIATTNNTLDRRKTSKTFKNVSLCN